jgi:adenylate kinase
MLRAAVKAGSDIGRKADSIMKAGDLVPDEIVTDLIAERLDSESHAPGFIFDGYPRTRAQAESLDALLAERGLKLDHVIELAVDEDALADRISGRFTCSRCSEAYHDRYKLPRVAGACNVCGSTEFKRRPDDNAETVRARLAVYRADTAPIMPYYEARGLVSRVDGMAGIQETTEAIEQIITPDRREQSPRNRARAEVDEALRVLDKALAVSPPIYGAGPGVSRNAGAAEGPLSANEVAALRTELHQIGDAIDNNVEFHDIAERHEESIGKFAAILGKCAEKGALSFAEEFGKKLGAQAASAKLWVGCYLMLSGHLSQILNILKEVAEHVVFH